MSNENTISDTWVVEAKRANTVLMMIQHVEIVQDIFGKPQQEALNIFANALSMAPSFRGAVIIETDEQTAKTLTQQANRAIDNCEINTKPDDVDLRQALRYVCFTCRPKVEPQITCR